MRAILPSSMVASSCTITRTAVRLFGAVPMVPGGSFGIGCIRMLRQAEVREEELPKKASHPAPGRAVRRVTGDKERKPCRCRGLDDDGRGDGAGAGAPRGHELPAQVAVEVAEHVALDGGRGAR